MKDVVNKPFPVLSDAKGEEMRQAILEAKGEQDSVGGAIECAVFGLPAGLQSDMYSISNILIQSSINPINI